MIPIKHLSKFHKNDTIGGVITTADEHSKIHDGDAYRMFVYDTITGNGTKYIQFKVGNDFVHLKDKTIVDGDNKLLTRFIEAPTVTDGTNPVNIYNCNRNSNKSSVLTVYDNPTNVSNGAVINSTYLAGTQQSSSTPQSEDIEWVLKPNTTYIYEIENLSADSGTYLIKWFWYE